MGLVVVAEPQWRQGGSLMVFKSTGNFLSGSWLLRSKKQWGWPVVAAPPKEFNGAGSWLLNSNGGNGAGSGRLNGNGDNGGGTWLLGSNGENGVGPWLLGSNGDNLPGP